MARSSGCPSSLTVAPALGLGVAGAVLAFVALCAVWLYQPPYRPTDEASHVAYARELSHGRLPTIDSLMSGDGDPRLARLLSSRDPVHRTIWTANHPPLYYALAAVPLRIAEATGHPIRGLLAARLLSVGLSTLGLIALAYTVRQLAPDRPQLAVAATGLTALLPGFINVSAVVYNDSLAFLTSTCALAASVVLVIRGPSAARLAAVAAAVGLAALTRASGLLVAGVAGLAVFVAAWRAGEGTVGRRLVRACAWVGALVATVVATAGWFYLRNRAPTATSPGRRRCWSGSVASPMAASSGCSASPGSGGASSSACGASPPTCPGRAGG